MSVRITTRNGPSQGSDTDFKVIFWNAGGLSNSKFLELKRSVLEKNVDIYVIVEAGAATDTPHLYSTVGYSTHVLKRSRQVASGIIIGIKTPLVCKANIIHEMQDRDKLEMFKVEVWKNSKHVTLFLLYNPPDNIPALELVEQQIQPRSQTRPDLVVTHPHITGKINVTLLDDAAGCGHRALLVTCKLAKDKKAQNRAPRWNFKKTDWKKYRECTNEVLTQLTLQEPEEATKKVSEAILKCAKECIPRGQIKGYKTFWSPTLSKLKAARDKARGKAEKSRQINDYIELRKRQAVLTQAIKSGKREAFKSFLAKLDFRKDGVKAHRFVTTLNNDGNKQQQMPMRGMARELTTHADIANELCKHYTKVSNIKINKRERARLLRYPPPRQMSKNINDICSEDFSMLELEAALSDTKTKKAAGIDELYPEMLKYLGASAKGTILNLINLTWNLRVPSQWRKSEVIPTLKKEKDPSLTDSYRPIFLTSSLCKVAEKMVLGRLNRALTHLELIDDAQAGFRKHRNTMDHVVDFAQKVKDAFHRKMSTVAVLVDLKAAYDTVWRGLLLHKIAN
ncbi:uncharacterized protein [Diabrotica undecimpunctata]|uniref:uncharacterized protein n=1 Tax=Diabrotica undecimpunctata TaxID=50387 RepID=UPI003B631D24